MPFPQINSSRYDKSSREESNMDRPAGSSPEISACTKRDYDRIVDDLPDFWDGRDMRQLHHPMLVNEFGNSAFVIRDGDAIAGYLFGFISQTAPVGYVHAIAVRSSARRRHLGRKLFDHFVAFARSRGCTHVKAITTPSNSGSIALARLRFTRAWAWSFWVSQIAQAFPSSRTTRAATNHASSSGRRSKYEAMCCGVRA